MDRERTDLLKAVEHADVQFFGFLIDQNFDRNGDTPFKERLSKAFKLTMGNEVMQRVGIKAIIEAAEDSAWSEKHLSLAAKDALIVYMSKIAKIGEALRHPKVDPYILFEMRRLQDELACFDPDQETVAFLARVKSESTKLDGIMARNGNIFGIITPYSALPDLVENPEVYDLEASR